MKGNQAILNSVLYNHEDNPIKENIGDKKALDIIGMITHEMWKEWRRELTHGEFPVFEAIGLGTFELMYGKSKSYLRLLIRKIRSIRSKHPEEYLIEGTRSHEIHKNYITSFRETWEQVDKIKLEVIKTSEIWKQKKIAKYGDKAIL